MNGNDDPQQDANTWFNLGLFYFKENNLSKARECWEVISREDDPKAYASARFNLGNSYNKENNLSKARECWEVITREDDPKAYAGARSNLSLSYFKENNLSKARECWEVITREDDPKAYVSARLNLGLSYFDEGNLSKARECWEVISREDDPKAYASARLNLGLSYNKENNLSKARECWEVITREDDPKAYASARFNLGLSYFKENNLSKARACWEVISREDDPEVYACARFNLGLSYNKENNLSKARDCWEVITREDDPKAYASARLNLGLSYFKENNLSKARECWEVISREDDPEAYAIVQTKLLFLFVREADNLQAHEYWKNLCEISVLPEYNWCGNEWLFFILKKINSFIPNNKDIDRAIELFKLLSNINDSAGRIRKALHMNSDLFCKALHMDSNLLDDNVIAHADLTKLEVFFAHYTKVEVAQKIIQNGSFHLGISNYMNDPTEGKILLTEWEIPVSYNDHLLAFLTSFTFNENSLNQFRLYGKENNKEGSGVSLVVTNSFFDNQFNPEKIAHVNTSWLYQNTYQIIPNLIDDKEKKNDQCKIDSKLKKLSDPLPLFRCIYMDPMTNYLSVAHQSKSSFRSNMSLYLDNKVEDIEVIFEKLWAFYIATMDQITKDVKTKLQEIKNNIDEIRNLIEQEITAHQNKIYEAIATTLLPIIYLTKHAAFEEEAECRILYITSILDDVIQWQGDRIYVEYTTNLADQYQQGKQSRHYLEKIYLGPNADPRAELGIKKCWIDKMRSKGMPNNDIKIPTLKKSEMPLAKS